jgi:hypothetical protein
VRLVSETAGRRLRQATAVISPASQITSGKVKRQPSETWPRPGDLPLTKSSTASLSRILYFPWDKAIGDPFCGPDK